MQLEQVLGRRPTRMVSRLSLLAALLSVAPHFAAAQSAETSTQEAEASAPDASRINELKDEAAQAVEERSKLVQEIVDSLFSFGELGFQESRTEKYLTGILESNGFNVDNDPAGIPTAWIATWGSGEPVISLGTDVDALPNMSQKPGVVYRDPIVEGAPGHGEGHNSGMGVNIVAALAVKEIMERESISGTIQIWPGIAEEALATKQYLVRAGVFDGVDVALVNHVADDFSTSYGRARGMGMVSVQYTFEGVSAHGAINPWEGRSALDAVELMDTGWNYRREHLRPQQRSHYVIVDGGDQPNVVPPTATVWYYFRELEYPQIAELYEIGNTMADAASMMTGTTVSRKLLGSSWPRYYSRPVAEAMQQNIEEVGMPNWDEKDNKLATAVQQLRGVEETSLATEVQEIGLPVTDPGGGPSNDLGAVTWTVPTASLSFPSNIPGAGAHNWTAAIAMATPIAHKGATAGAKVTAMTMLDLFLRPELVKQAKTYFEEVQTKDVQYTPFESAEDQPAIELNEATMAEYRDEMEANYYDPTRYDSYMEQLGITYPTIEKTAP